MKTFNSNSDMDLTDEMNSLISKIRDKKDFSASTYLKYKKIAVSNYLKKHNIDSVVIGISGGIDSAVSLGILSSLKDDGVIENIYAVSMPAHDQFCGVTNQIEACNKAKIVITHFNLNVTYFDLSKSHYSLRMAIGMSTKMWGSEWAKGQLVPNLRTAASYFLTSVLSDKDNKAVVIGTINRSEGSYLGYMGKAGDSLVDIQLISDLYKSEVYQLAKHFGIPSNIINAAPNGDMHDNRTDEEVFGATYDFVELYLSYLQDKTLISNLSEKSLDRFDLLASRLESVHNHNAHKYISSSPAIHLDLYDTRIDGGWKNNSTYNIDKPLDPNKLVNFIPITDEVLDQLSSSDDCLFRYYERKLLLDFANSYNWIPADKNGKANKSLLESEIGSYRATIYSDRLANIVSSRVKNDMDYNEFVIKDDELYRYVGVSSSFRLIKYKSGGSLVPHYDSSFSLSDKKRTLFSVVIYLQIAESGGSTVFLNETRVDHNYEDWDDHNYEDWDDHNYEDWDDYGGFHSDQLSAEEYHSMVDDDFPITIFDHQTLHCSTPVLAGEKIIIRTDLVYEKIA